MKQVWDNEKGRMVYVEDDPIATMVRIMNGPQPVLTELDTALAAEPTGIPGVVVGSITFAPDPAKPAYCASCVQLQAEVERLRAGNAALLKELNVERAQ